jgi:hypothetical protein
MPRLRPFVSLLVVAPALAMSACVDAPPRETRSLAASAPSRADTLADRDLASDAVVPADPAGDGTDEDLGSLDLERENPDAAADPLEPHQFPCDEVIGPMCIMHGRE